MPLLQELDVLQPELSALGLTPAKPSDMLGSHDDDKSVALVERDETVHWQDEAGLDDVSRGFDLREEAGNTIHEKLAALDTRMTPMQGLSEVATDGSMTLQGDAWHPTAGAKRVLLIVHGTFSESAKLLSDALGRDEAFLDDARARYDRIVAFNYGTLSRSAMANAMVLARRFGGSDAEIDVICHSQGGLVTRWWLEAFEPQLLARTRVAFVGGTLMGTGLAAPPKLKAALDYMTNVGLALKAGMKVATAALPFLAPVVGVLGVVRSVVKTITKTPVLDAGVAVVPGLAQMSRVGTNAGLDGLSRLRSEAPPGYHAIGASFEPQDWKFWKNFVQRTARPVANLIFDADNDLVVETASTYQLGPGREIPESRRRIINDGETFHTNYFDRPIVHEQLRAWFEF
ncbi:MAG: hypothetical protein AAF721_22655 [Myxococcota bacterium]